jgi:ABC-type sugar transport system permease subunit
MIFDIFVGIGGNLMIWLGSMSRIPKELIEVGKLEGIGPFTEFRKVVLPLIWPTFVTMITLQVIGIFGATGCILLLTPNVSETFTFGYWIYDQVRRYQSYYIPSALGLLFTLVAYPLCLLVRKLVTSFYQDVD